MAFWQLRTDWAPSLLVVGPGRTNDEHSVVWVEDYRYKGFGFLPKDQPISHPEELEDYLQPAEDSAYARALVRGHINQHHEDKVVVLERKPVLAD
jgi:DNA polymerase III subunit epsilon